MLLVVMHALGPALIVLFLRMQAQHTGKTILLVEDDSVVALFENAHLQQCGYRVMMAASGTQAVEMADASEEVDLVLMDIDLGDGIEGTEAARRILSRHDLPIVFLSSHTDPETVRKTESISSYGYVVKNSGMPVLEVSLKMAFRLFEARQHATAQTHKLRNSERRLRRITDNISDVVFTADLELHTTYISPSVERLIGDSVEEHLRKPVEAKIPPDSLAAIRAMLHEELENEQDPAADPGRTRILEVQQYRANGSLVDVSMHVGFIRDDNGTPVGIQGVVRDITKRKRIEERLRLNIRRWKQAQTIAQIGNWEFDINTDQIWGSEEAFRLYGINLNPNDNPHHLIALHRVEACIPDRQRVHEALVDLIKNNTPYDLEYDIIRENDGRRITVRSFAGQIRDAQGHLRTIAGTIQDITAAKQMERALRDSEQRYRTLFETLPIPVFTKDRDGRYTSSNAENLKYWAVNPVGKTDAELLPPDTATSFRTIDLRVMRTDQGISLEEHFSETPLGERYVLTRKIPLHDSAGQVTGVLGASLDITERKRTEAALEQRIMALTLPFEDAGHLAFDDLFNRDDIQRLQDEFSRATGVASIITYPDGQPITAPSNFCRLCRDIVRGTEQGRHNCYHSDAMLGRYHPEGPVVQPCLSGGLWDAGASISVGGRHLANWLIGQVRDETQTENHMRAYAREIGVPEDVFLEAFREVPTMSRGQFERIAQMLFTLARQLSTMAYQNVQQARFIAERKRAEEALRQLNDDLETRVSLRTAELETANRELQEFAYIVSHDLKAPLRGIAQLTHWLREDYGDTLDEQGQQQLRLLGEQAKRMSRLIDGVLQYSRATSGHEGEDDVDVQALMPQIIDGLAPPANVAIHVADTLPIIRGNPVRITQVFQNLLSNAMKFTDPEHGVISIGVAETATDWTFWVQDNGRGIEAHHHARIFQLFQSCAPQEQQTGSGIGLTIVKKIIEQQGGRIWVESTPGQGSRFLFTWRRLPAPSTSSKGDLDP